MRKPQQILSLTATRGIAALLVVVFHFGCTISPFSRFEHFFRNGNLAVSYFFVLSGFVMYISYSRMIISFKDFLLRRLGRVGPAYLLAILLSIIVAHLYLSPEYDKEFFKQLFLNVFFLQTYDPGYALTINSPGWSLSVEMFFYLLFPILLIFARNHSRRFVIFAVSIYIISQLIHLGMIYYIHPVYPSQDHEMIYYHPLLHLNEFLVGIAACYFYQAGKFKSVCHFNLFILAVIVLLINYFAHDISMHNGLLAPLFALLIIGLSYKEPVFLNNKPMLLLGKLSFAIYILQMPVYIWVLNMNETYLHFGETTHFYFYLVILFICSFFSYYLVEEPLRRMINNLLEKRRTKKAAH